MGPFFNFLDLDLACLVASNAALSNIRTLRSMVTLSAAVF